MFLVLEHGKAILAAARQERTTALSPVRQELRAWPWWCDTFGHVNHAKYLDIASVGRVALLVRAGLLRPAMQQHYGYLIVGASLTYRREIPYLSPFVLETQLAAYDARWATFTSTFLLLDAGIERVAARAIIRVQLRDRRGGKNPIEVLRGLGVDVPAGLPASEDVVDQLQAQEASIAFIRRREGRS